MNGKSTINDTQIDFALMDILVDRYPDASDAELLALYQQHLSDCEGNTIELLTGKVTDRTQRLFNQATEAKVPHEAHSNASYRIGQRLQSGGQSDVFLAHRDGNTFHQTLVIKRLRYTVAQKANQKHLLQEMQILADLKHPNIVTIMDAGIDDHQHPWMILEYINGQHLNDYLRQQQLSINDTVKLLLDIANALYYVHQQGICHLDIKPSNILIEVLDGNVRPVIIDFGIAMGLNNGVDLDPNVVMATPAFAAPEQMDSSHLKVDHQSDIYSFGKLLQYLLTAHGILDVDLQSIIDCCLSVDKGQRYTNMQKLSDDLDYYLNGHPVSVRKQSALERIYKTIQRNSWFVGSVTLIALIICGLLVYMWQQQSLNEKQQKQIRSVNQYYWQQAQSIDSDAALLFVKPTQNIQQSYAQLQQRYDQLALQLSKEYMNVDTFPMARAASRLGRLLDAQKYLKKAQSLRTDDPEVLLSMAKNNLNLYHKNSQSVIKHQEPQLQKTALANLRQQWIVPALEWLEQINGQLPAEQAIIQGLILYHQGQGERALSILAEKQLASVWPVESLILSAQILKDAGQQKLLQGQQSNAFDNIRASAYALKQAHDIARSDPLVAEQWCQLEVFAAPFDEALSEQISGGCALMRSLLPTDSNAIEWSAHVVALKAKKAMDNGNSPLILIDQAIALLEAIDAKPSAQHLNNLGMLTAMQARWMTVSGQNGMQTSLKAIDYFKQAVKKSVGDYHIQMNLADILYDFANLYYTVYDEAESIFEESEYWYEQLTHHPQSNVFLYTKMVKTLTDHAYRRYKGNLKADAVLQKAEEIFEKLNENWPHNANATIAGAYFYWTYADYLIFKNQEPEPYFSKAVEYFQQSIVDDPQAWVWRYNYISLLLINGHHRLQQNINQALPMKHIDEQMTLLKEQVADEVDLHSHFGYYHNLMAMQAALDQKSPKDSLLEAKRFNLHSINSKIDRYAALTHLTTTLTLMVQHTPQFFVEDDLKPLQAGLKEFPDHHQLRALYGRLLSKMAEHNLNEKTQLLKAAREQLSRAMTSNPLLNGGFRADLIAVERLLLSLQNH